MPRPFVLYNFQKKKLETMYLANPRPSAQEMKNCAREFRLPLNCMELWFTWRTLCPSAVHSCDVKCSTFFSQEGRIIKQMCRKCQQKKSSNKRDYSLEKSFKSNCNISSLSASKRKISLSSKKDIKLPKDLKYNLNDPEMQPVVVLRKLNLKCCNSHCPNCYDKQ